jgi:5-methylcytosine-specific restriction endonuclease McrA
MKSKVLSESRMNKLWREAVLIKCKHQCQLCGLYGDDNLQCHHIIKRRYKTTRWYYKNGCALCHACHSAVETKSGVRRKLENNWKYMAELEYLNSFDYKTYLTEHGRTHEEYYGIMEKLNKGIINGR